MILVLKIRYEHERKHDHDRELEHDHQHELEHEHGREQFPGSVNTNMQTELQSQTKPKDLHTLLEAR